MADGLGGAASNADVDFVEDQGAGGGELLFWFDCALFDADLEGQHDAAHFAARGDLVEGLERFAGVGRDAVLDLIPAVCGPVGGRSGDSLRG